MRFCFLLLVLGVHFSLCLRPLVGVMVKSVLELFVAKCDAVLRRRQRAERLGFGMSFLGPRD